MKRILQIGVWGLIGLALLGSCHKSSPAGPCMVGLDTLAVPDSQTSAIQTYLFSNNLTATEYTTGLFYSIQEAGSGTVPTLCSEITVQFKGMLTNGTVFDSTAGQSTVNLPLDGLILGWEVGMLKIGVGGSITLYVPPLLGYGSSPQYNGSGQVIVPPNSILIYKINLVAVGAQ